MKLNKVIDRKFTILAVNPCKVGAVYTERDGVFFAAKDVAFLEGALPGYRAKCEEIGCGQEHLDSIDLLTERVRKYQEGNKKIPDTETSCEMDRCIGGIGVDDLSDGGGSDGCT